MACDLTSERSEPIRIAFVGGGPRSIGIIERIVASADLLNPDTELELLVFDPYPAGPGRIWRFDQSPSLKMNSLAEDVAVFTDSSCQVEGPVVPGPTLAEWFDLVRAGAISFDPPDDGLAAELATNGPQSFTTRRLFSCYMRWFWEHVCSSAPANIHIEEIRSEVTHVREADGMHLLEFTDEAGRPVFRRADLVIYAVGHTDSKPTSIEVETAGQAEALDLRYWPAQYANDSDIDNIPADEPVLIRGLGLSFIDIVVRLTLDRDGREIVDLDAPPGYRTTYVPSGREPRMFAGSRRGVPYHSKITSHFHGERPGLTTTFVTRDSLESLLDSRDTVDFWADVWPSIVREMAYWHYREIFTGHPERVRGSWVEISQLLRAHELGSIAVESALDVSVSREDRFRIDSLTDPLQGVEAHSLSEFQSVIGAYIERDIVLREVEEHSETLAVFWACLASYLVVAETLGHPSWSADSRLHQIPRRWHDFFSYLDSGPPASRLELVLALQRAGLLTFVGGDLDVRIDEAEPAFVARSLHQPEQVTARHLVEGFHPERTIERSTNPALRDLLATAQGAEQILNGKTGSVSTQRLHVDFDSGNVVRPDGTQHARRFAIGDFTSSPPAGAFARPNTNGRIFRENDRIARQLLMTTSTLVRPQPEPALTR